MTNIDDTIQDLRRLTPNIRQRKYEELIRELSAVVKMMNIDHDALLEQWNDIVRASGSRTHGGAVGVVAGMRADLARMIAEREAACTWKEEDEGLYWATECGEAFAIIEGSPDQNGLWYCCFCGKRLAEAK